MNDETTRKGWATRQMRASRLTIPVALLILCGPHSYSQSRTEHPADACSILARPSDFSGKRVEVRGLVSFVTGDAAPPQLVTGDCPGGIPIFMDYSELERRSNGFRELLRAELKPHPTSDAARRIWATFSGVLTARGGAVSLQVQEVRDVVALPNFSVRAAQMPAFPASAGVKGGKVVIVITIRHGRVIAAHTLGSPDAALAAESLRNVRTWRFNPELNARTTTVFEYRVVRAANCPPSNPQIVLRLPETVVITRWTQLPCMSGGDKGVSRSPGSRFKP